MGKPPTGPLLLEGEALAHVCSSGSFILLQSLAKLTDGFRNNFSLSDPLQEAPHHPGAIGSSQQFCDAGSQTDIIGEVSHREESSKKGCCCVIISPLLSFSAPSSERFRLLCHSVGRKNTVSHTQL